ncbi:MAG: hypothetical protein KC547_11005, partial [Anaerolineae bacterium]|nr:hypothetical protein [Anaerolineae bacterium]
MGHEILEVWGFTQRWKCAPKRLKDGCGDFVRLVIRRQDIERNHIVGSGWVNINEPFTEGGR